MDKQIKTALWIGGGLVLVGGAGYIAYKVVKGSQAAAPTYPSPTESYPANISSTQSGSSVSSSVSSSIASSIASSNTTPTGLATISGWSAPHLISNISAHDQFWAIYGHMQTTSSAGLQGYGDPAALGMNTMYDNGSLPLYPSHSFQALDPSQMQWAIQEQYTLQGYVKSSGAPVYEVINNFFIELVTVPSGVNGLGVVGWSGSGARLITYVVPLGLASIGSNMIQGTLMASNTKGVAAQPIATMAFFPVNVSKLRYGPLSTPVAAPVIPNTAAWQTFRASYGLG